MEEMFGGIVYGKRAGEESLPVAVNWIIYIVYCKLYFLLCRLQHLCTHPL